MDSAIEVVANLLGIHRETFKPGPWRPQELVKAVSGLRLLGG
jgi:hypothetical protein